MPSAEHRRIDVVTARKPPERIAITLRFAPRTHRIIKAIAEQEGQPMSQWIREALLLRVGYVIGVEQGRLPAQPSPEELDAIRAAVREILHEWREDG
jgi:hypothetical protein